MVTDHQTYVVIISRTGKATDFKFGRYIHRVDPNKSPLKIFQKRERGRIQGLPKFLGTPYYLWNGESYGFQTWQVHSRGPSKQKFMKNFRDKWAWAYPGTAQFFGYPLLSQARLYSYTLYCNNCIGFRRWVLSLSIRLSPSRWTSPSFSDVIEWHERAAYGKADDAHRTIAYCYC